MQILKSSPFSQLEWNDYSWTGSILLPAWQGFQSRSGAYDSQSSVAPLDDSTQLDIVTPKNEPLAPSSEQVAAYRHLIEHQELVRDAILQAVFDKYGQWQEEYDYDEEEAAKYMPDIEQPSQFKALIGLSTVRIFKAFKAGVAYAGFGFGCTWDDEHALGIMTHIGRVVEIGGADTAILEWIADKDAELS